MSSVLPSGLWLLSCQTAQIALAVVLTELLSRYWQSKAARLLHVFWLVTLVKAVLPPLWASPSGIFSWALAPHASEAAGKAAWRAAGAVTVQDPAMTAGGPLLQVAAGATLGIWLVGALAVGTVWCLLWQRLRRAIALQGIPPSPELQAQYARLASELGLARPPQLVVTTAPIGPALFGVFRPIILVPQHLVAVASHAQMRSVLAHELIHFRRRDHWVGLLQTLATAVWWFHPAVWWTSKRICQSMERCVDLEVLRFLPDQALAYAQSLVKVLELKCELPRFAGMTGVRGDDVTVERLQNILYAQRFPAATSRARKHWPNVVAGVAMASIMLPGAGLTWFAPPPPAPCCLKANLLRQTLGPSLPVSRPLTPVAESEAALQVAHPPDS